MKSLLSVISLVVASTLIFYSANSISATQNPDAQVIAQLVSVGSNLNEPHHIKFFFYFPAKENAKRIAAKLNTDGYSTSVSKSLSSHEYVIQARKSMIPVLSALVALRERFNVLSASESGYYDGWGAEVAQ
jgi:ABC-type antimicrobial peptide transport system permease subunit